VYRYFAYTDQSKGAAGLLRTGIDKMFEAIIQFIKSLFPNENPVPLHAPRFTGNEKKYLIL
jgi:hypothetical protein